MNRKTVNDTVKAAGLAALVVVSIPLLFGLAFFYRTALFAGIALGLVGIVVAVVVSPNVRGHFRSMVEPEVEYKGMRLSTEVLLGPGHSWARVARDGAFVGLDDLAGTCLGPVDRVELPPAGLEVRHGEPLFAVAHGNRRIETRSPIDGTIVAANEQLRKDPGRVNRDPYGLGWIVRLRNDDPRRERRHLKRGFEAEKWFRHEVDRLVSLVGRSETLAPSLPDGGVVAEGLDRLIDEATWQTLRSDLFEQDPQSWKEVSS